MTELLVGDRCGWPAGQIAAIEDAADPSDLSRQLMKAVAGAEDLLLVYYVGHGFRMLNNRLALALRETSPATEALPHTAMRYEELAEIVSGCPAATKVLILDCCRAERGRWTTTSSRRRNCTSSPRARWTRTPRRRRARS